MSELKFSLRLKEMSVSIDDKPHVLRELSGKQRDAYLNEIGPRMKFNVEGKTEGLTNYDGLQSGLLALCLYDEGGVLVKEKVLQEWPASVLSDLFDAAQKLSGLDKGAEKKAKNDSGVKD